jgi:hypothetical protein
MSATGGCLLPTRRWPTVTAASRRPRQRPASLAARSNRGIRELRSGRNDTASWGAPSWRRAQECGGASADRGEPPVHRIGIARAMWPDSDVRRGEWRGRPESGSRLQPAVYHRRCGLGSGWRHPTWCRCDDPIARSGRQARGSSLGKRVRESTRTSDPRSAWEYCQAALSQDQLDITQTEAEDIIQPQGMTDDL